VYINDNFAKLSESLYVADRHAREEVRQRALMQQKIAEKQKASKEENLRLLAQRAREERNVGPSSAAVARPGALKSALAAYGSDSESGSGSGSEAEKSDKEDEDDADEEARKIRDQMRRDKKQERERELRMNNMGAEQRAKHFAREQNRDISEKIALGLAKPTLSKESMLDSRLFNRESLQGAFGDEENYNLYDRPLFHGSSAAAAIYKSRGAMNEGNDETLGGGTEEGISNALANDRFGLGSSKLGRGLGFEGSVEEGSKDGPVQFEKDVSIMPTGDADVFGVDKFLDEAKRGVKRGLDTSGAESRKRQQLDRAEDRE